MVDVNSLKLDREIKVTGSDGKTKEGIVKGINKDCNDKVTVAVEYLIPTRQNFELDKIIEG